MIRKGIRITPTANGVKFEAHKVNTLDCIKALTAIAFHLRNEAEMSREDILRAADAGMDGSAFKEIK